MSHTAQPQSKIEAHFAFLDTIPSWTEMNGTCPRCQKKFYDVRLHQILVEEQGAPCKSRR